MKNLVPNCPVCQTQGGSYTKDIERSYLKCSVCQLVFVPREELISPDKEKSRYDKHVIDSSYRTYVENLGSLILPLLTSGARGLDFGCGQTTFLSDFFARHNYPVESYDLFYYPHTLQTHYDFIVLSEVIEHLREPGLTFQDLRSRLRPDGLLFIKTEPLPPLVDDFDNWYYKRDYTHVQFFSEKTFSFLANRYSMIFEEMPSKNLFVLRSIK